MAKLGEGLEVGRNGYTFVFEAFRVIAVYLIPVCTEINAAIRRSTYLDLE
jgi:hypothetical protein